MRQIIFYSIFILTVGVVNALAQLDSSAPQQYYSHSFIRTSGEAAANTPEWQLTLDVIKAKTETLMEKNNKLMADRESLIKEYKDQQEAIRSWQVKTQDLQQFLKQRHGRSDEDIKAEELNDQVKQKKAQLKDLQNQLNNFNKQVEGIDQKIHLKKLKISDLKLRKNQEGLDVKVQQMLKESEISQKDDGLDSLKQQFQQHKAQEEALQQQVKDLQYKHMASVAMPPQVDEQQIKALEEKKESLRRQKEDLQKRFNSDNSQANLQRYQVLMTRKNELEDKIKSFDSQLNELNKSQSKDLVDNKSNKQLIKQMVQLDNRNARLRQQISIFGENVSLLKTQVKRLERRLNLRKNSSDKTK